MIFPAWALYMVPFFWFIVLPANFVIDSIVVLAALAFMKVPEKKHIYRKIIFKVWGLGFAADILGSICLMVMLGFAGDITQYKYRGLEYDPAAYPIGIILITVSIIISGILIFIFNYYGHFRTLDLDPGKRKKLALTLAIATAPYLMYLPTETLYTSL